jgi:aminoglycoside phosphotransferase (APT) family kinase protein
MVDRLVELHAVDVPAAGLQEFGRGPGYVERQVTGWSERYRAAKTWNVPSFATVMAWLEQNRPDDVGSCLIHNDWRFDNLVLDPADPARILGVLDWEMATVGDPLMDLGSALAYWIQADDDRLMGLLRRQPTHLPGMLTRREVVERYAERSGRTIDDWTFYEVFGLFRLAVIVQQIYFRYHHKQTRNPAFRHFWIAVNYLDRRCRRLIRGS